ncbi:hypothetical protein [uncultured Bilophila sp.]|uniref:hypothetical protein n=1 Tax=uncultured Bilophila sp. TaxID=529385 RepID=UPI00280C1640|nr:hypothetical protein [uncultured Bilophila sp.]
MRFPKYTAAFYLAKQEEGPEYFPGFYYGFYCVEDVKWPKQKALLYMWLFHFHSAVKNRAFFPVFPLGDPRLRYFWGYPFGVSRKKASTIFYNTAKQKGTYWHSEWRFLKEEAIGVEIHKIL